MEKDNVAVAIITRQIVTNLPLLNGITQHFLFPCIQFFDHFLLFSELVQTCEFFPKNESMYVLFMLLSLHETDKNVGVWFQ